ncbi:hypothetical protein MJH12_17735 [bacterium]|nr:hypothetical protein [bacterium]
MTKLFQITFFYSIMALIITGLLGFYPRIDPTFFTLDMHKSVATNAIYTLFLVQALGIFLFFKKKKELKEVFYKTEHAIEELKSSLKDLNKYLFVLCINFAFIIIPLVTGIMVAKGSIPKAIHFHGNSTCVLLMALIFLYVTSKIESIDRKITEYRKISSYNYIEPAFIDDENKRGFELALKFLFLGINVWTPYLILKYGVGMTMLKGLYFLPIHLAGVLPFSFLKRKYKFARTINPNYKGTIKKREKYQEVAEA